jgi:microcompartment protein CcmK/EutM
VLINRGTWHRREIELDPGMDHCHSQGMSLLFIQTLKADCHQQRRYLVVWDATVDVAFDNLVYLSGGKPLTMALLQDQINRTQVITPNLILRYH